MNMKNSTIQLIHGDCLDVMKSFNDKSVSAIITDIPYGVVNRESNGLRNLDKGKADIVTFDIPSMLDSFIRICYGTIYVFCGTEQVSQIREYLADYGLSTRLCIWEKTNPSPMNGQHLWLSSIECCVFAKFKNATFNEHCKSSVWRFPTVKGKVHPTMKPLKLMEYLVETSTNNGDTVLDPFMGSGTTGVACKNLNRNFIGIELYSGYFKIAEDRINIYERGILPL